MSSYSWTNPQARKTFPVASTLVCTGGGGVVGLRTSQQLMKQVTAIGCSMDHGGQQQQQLARAFHVPAWKQELPSDLMTRLWLTKVDVATTTNTSSTTTEKTDDEDNSARETRNSRVPKKPSPPPPPNEEHITELFMIGVKHSSTACADHVQQLLHATKPDTIFLELCKERVISQQEHQQQQQQQRSLQKGSTEESSFLESDAWFGVESEAEEEYIKQFGRWNDDNNNNNNNKTTKNWLTTDIDAAADDDATREEGWVEMQTALDYASKTTNKQPSVWFVDRPVSRTRARIDDMMSNKYALQLRPLLFDLDMLYCNNAPYSFLVNDGDEANTQAARDDLLHIDPLMALAYTADQPIRFNEEKDINRVLFQERDIVMACRVLQHCQVLKPERAVLVVGAIHLKGMENLLHAKNIMIDGGGDNNQQTPENIMATLFDSREYPMDDKRFEEEIMKGAPGWIRTD